MPVVTRKGSLSKTMSTDKEIEMSDATGDVLWDSLMRLPYFRLAALDRKQELYEKEKEKEREKERERMEFERQEKEKEREREKEKERIEFERQEKEKEREQEKERERIEFERQEKEREFELRKLQIERESKIRELSAERRRASNPTDPSPSRKPNVNIPAWIHTTRPDKFFITCEKLFAAACTPRELWVGLIIDKLSQRARDVYSSLGTREANDYDQLKAAILAEYRISPTIYRKNFFTWVKRPGQTYAEYVKSLKEQLDLWVNDGDTQNINWPELLLRYRFESQLSDELNLYILDKKASDFQECITLADEFTLNRKLLPKSRSGQASDNRPSKRSHTMTESGITDRNDSTGAHGTNTVMHDRLIPPGQNSRSRRPTKYCTYCHRSGHELSDCWANPAGPKYRGTRRPENTGNHTRPSQTHSTAFVSELRELEPETVSPLLRKYTGQALVRTSETSDPCSVTYLRDTGCTISTLTLPPGLELDKCYTGENVKIRGVNYVSGNYPLADVHVTSSVYTGPLRVAVLNHKVAAGITLLIGNEIDDVTEKPQLTCGVVTRSSARREHASNDIDLQPTPWEDNGMLTGEAPDRVEQTDSVNYDPSLDDRAPDCSPRGYYA